MNTFALNSPATHRRDNGYSEPPCERVYREIRRQKIIRALVFALAIVLGLVQVLS